MNLTLTIVHILASLGLLVPLALPSPYAASLSLATAIGIGGHIASALALNGKGNIYAYSFGLLYSALLLLVGIGTFIYILWNHFFAAMNLELVLVIIYLMAAILGALSLRYIYVRGKTTNLNNET